MKILYVIDSLASKGGAERIVTEKMNSLASHYGHEVTVVTCYQDTPAAANTYPLSPLVRQVDLGIPFYSQYKVGYPRRLFVKWGLRRRLVRKLTAAVALADPDVLVGLSYFCADVVCAIPCRAKKVVESHDARRFTLLRQGLGRSPVSESYMRWFRRHYFRQVERRADAVVTLTTGDAHEWRRARRVAVIPNFSILPVTALSTGRERRVLAVGRLEWQKGFDRLLDAWAIVARSHPGWRLDIIGSGTLEGQLRRQIREAGLTQSTAIMPFTEQISREYASSSLFVLSSRFEGFSLVLLEAMRHGVPCVAFDCPYGPSDVLADGQCGLLAREGDTQQLAERIGTLIDDDSLRQRFAKAAIERAKCFDHDSIMQQWHNLFSTL